MKPRSNLHASNFSCTTAPKATTEMKNTFHTLEQRVKLQLRDTNDQAPVWNPWQTHARFFSSPLVSRGKQ